MEGEGTSGLREGVLYVDGLREYRRVEGHSAGGWRERVQVGGGREYRWMD